MRYKLLLHPTEAARGLWYHCAAEAFDRWHGVETGKRGITVRYDPTEPKYIRWAFRNLPIDPRTHSFVDFGSGKGRVLIAAAERPFAQVIGVEYSKELHDEALKNIASARHIQCRDVRSLNLDAVDFPIPNSPCVFFFYNPFRGQTMERVLANIRAALQSTAPRKFFLIYVNPVMHDLFLQQAGMRLVRSHGWCNLYCWSFNGNQ